MEMFFDQFIKLNRGFDLPNDKIVYGDFPVVGSTDVKGFHNVFKVKGPGVVTGRSGSLGSVQYIKSDYWPLNTSLYVKDFKGSDPRFVYYFLKTMNLENFNSGAGVPTLNQNHLHKLKIIVPSLELQSVIASLLSNYDELIDLNNQRIKLIEETAQELYKEWFIRMRFPGYANMEFIKGAPKNWEPTYFRNFIKLNRGFDLPEDKIVPGPYPVVASTSIKAYHNRYKVEAPCIATGRSGSLGTVQYINQKSWPLNTSLYVKDFKGNSPFYVYYFLKGLNLESFNAGAGVPSLNQNHLHSIKFFLPPVDLQGKFADIIRPRFQQIENFQQQNAELCEIRDRLLPRLISGKLKIKIAEEIACL